MLQNCKICKEESLPLFSELILNKYTVNYYQCKHCRFIQTESPYWLNEAYQSAINVSDTGIIQRNEILRKMITTLIFFTLRKDGTYLDYAGGYGIFTRMMRDVGLDFYWLDEFAENLIARGFEHKENTLYNAITAFEVFEHLSDPLTEIDKMLKYSDTIMFSTVLLPDKAPSRSWWYYGFNHGQHIALYHNSTLEIIARRLNLNLYSDGKQFHILTKRHISPMIINLLLKLNKIGLYHIVKLMLSGKTNSDHLLLAKHKYNE